MPPRDSIPYTVRFQRRRTIALHVLGDGGFEVRAPLGYRSDWINEFVASRAEWAMRARDRQLQRQQWRQPLVAGGESWLLGEPLRVDIARGRRFDVAASADTLHITAPASDDTAAVERRLQRWYREQAAAVFGARLADCCARFPRPVALPSLSLRRMRRRWGSCSRSGEITLNVDLVRLAPELIDYVIMHELCHLFEFNHSARFYALQAEAVPDWRAREAWLKQF